ncbi:glycerol dehydratase reactivase beta/small subunit family protein [Rubrobacter marinus]|uniref:glycerol dehydratase reactivase beta/small subunit family protein n=1 Tax=Rubrobacter marinus TaxID=2653852 RepID=UPI00140DFF66|nr:glycerol dehydratase reactivase beta/small subunit family protein [Rubrobacter marinus]
MTPDEPERPAIHVALGNEADERLYGRVAVGAEEEGIPCRLVPEEGSDAVALAFSAAGSSRLGVGVGVASGRVAVHERHMPAGRPVVATEAGDRAEDACRQAGSNAARLVIGVPLWLLQER